MRFQVVGNDRVYEHAFITKYVAYRRESSYHSLTNTSKTSSRLNCVLIYGVGVDVEILQPVACLNSHTMFNYRCELLYFIAEKKSKFHFILFVRSFASRLFESIAFSPKMRKKRKHRRACLIYAITLRVNIYFEMYHNV